VARGVHDKLVARHPHVFAADAGAGGPVASWEELKRAEKGRLSPLDGIPATLPALAYAAKVQSRAASVGFDWADADGALPKIDEELAELAEARRRGQPGAVLDELGDVLFAVVNVARHLDVDPEAALRHSAAKFTVRFRAVEALAAGRGVRLADSELAVLDALWEEVKQDEQR
jgi:MazG family protein